MFDNVLYQDATTLLAQDILRGELPQSILLAGSSYTGKLTSALEIARILSCTGSRRGDWLCTCSSCLKHKSLSSTDVLIAGNRSCECEIAGSYKTLLEAYEKNATWIQASRYLFVRSVRKLTSRFNPILWEGDDKVSKISPLITSIDELLEELDPLKPCIPLEQFKKLAEKLIDFCTKLENTFMYDSIPISHIRKAASWAHYTIANGKRIFIIEKADKMPESTRNALLKTLEEPPEQSVFILLAENRNAIMPTILSRVRTYSFVQRNYEQNAEVLKRIYHINDEQLNILVAQSRIDGDVLTAYHNMFIPISHQEITIIAKKFMHSIRQKDIPNLDELIKSLKNFEPRSILKLFFYALLDEQKQILMKTSGVQTSLVSEQSAAVLEALKTSFTNITIYNQSIRASFEALVYSLLKVL